MMHPHLPSPLRVAVPDIGFAQSISISPKAPDWSGFADVSGEPLVVSQLVRPTGTFGSHRYGHGSRFTPEDMAFDVRVRHATSLLCR
jgi:hypothetical protein